MRLLTTRYHTKRRKGQVGLHIRKNVYNILLIGVDFGKLRSEIENQSLKTSVLIMKNSICIPQNCYLFPTVSYSLYRYSQIHPRKWRICYVGVLTIIPFV